MDTIYKLWDRLESLEQRVSFLEGTKSYRGRGVDWSQYDDDRSHVIRKEVWSQGYASKDSAMSATVKYAQATHRKVIQRTIDPETFTLYFPPLGPIHQED